MSREQEGIENAIPEDVQLAFERALHEQETEEVKVLAIKPESLFAVTEEVGSITYRTYFGYSENDGNFDFAKRVKLVLESLDDEFTPRRIDWYDEQGEEVLLSLLSNHSLTGKTASYAPAWTYNLNLGNLHAVISWDGRVEQEGRKQFESIIANGIVIHELLLDSLYKGENYLEQGFYTEPKYPTVEDGHIRHGAKDGHTVEGDYDNDKEVVNFNLKTEDGETVQITISRYVDFERLVTEIFPTLLRQDITSTNTEVDRNWKDNDQVNRLLGLTIVRPHNFEKESTLE